MASEYQIEIITEPVYQAEASQNLRLLYVVDGSCSVLDGASEQKMDKADLYMVNAGASLHIAQAEGGMLSILTVDYHRLCDTLRMSRIHFSVNSHDNSQHSYIQLRSAMQHFLMAYASQEQANPYQVRSAFFRLLYVLTSDFMETEQESLADRTDIERILHYINSHYNQTLSLNEIAEILCMSPSSASRFFQKATGSNFATYIKRVRLEHVRDELEQTDKMITQIALDNGLSTPSALNKAFKAEFGITPGEWREKYGFFRAQQEDQTAQKAKMLHILMENSRETATASGGDLRMEVDLRKMQPYRKWENKLLNVGPAHVLSSANMQKHILFLVKTLHVEYIRIWNIFSPRMMIDTGKQGEYNFTFVDEILDYCVDHHLKLFLDLSQRKDFAMASERKVIYSRDEKMVFESQQDWLSMLDAFLQHIRERYEESTVGSWIFEIPFFLNDHPYYRSEDYREITVWELGFRHIKWYIPSARIAGPGLIGSIHHSDRKKLVQQILTGEQVPDIFTFIHFPYQPADSFPGQKTYRKQVLRDSLKEAVTQLQEFLQNYHFKGEYWVTEWGSSIANRNFMQDSCFRGAYIVDQVLQNLDGADAMGIFYASDQINAWSDTVAVLSGSAGILTRTGICKPAYYAFRFLDRLGHFRIAQNEHCFVTAENANDIRILCYHPKSLGAQYYLREENSFQPRELPNLFENKEALTMEISINLPEAASRYRVRQKILNQNKGSVLDKWIQFDCALSLSRSDQEYLEKVSEPETTMEFVKPQDGTFSIRFTMEPNEIRLITITGIE